ncbi:MAG TPA: tetratricopeptide repeat protein [Micropepsaceae bacterium]|nr:tetratricopeptide repeat protein [Micropepsaceae bacterium]
MAKNAFSTSLATAFLLLLNVGASAGPFEDGAAASQRGDNATALKLWRPLAEQGNASAQFNIGLMYKVGKGVSQDYSEAVRWFRLAAKQGNVLAQTNLGVAYENGQGTPQSYVRAYVWYDLAASSAVGPFAEGLTKIRDEVAGKLAPAELADAKQLEQRCKQSHLQQCE